MKKKTKHYYKHNLKNQIRQQYTEMFFGAGVLFGEHNNIFETFL